MGLGEAAIGGVSTVASGVMGGKAAKEAAKTQLQANREALAFEREKKAAEEKRYADAMNLWLSGRRQLLDRYGLPASALGPFETANYATPTPYRAPTEQERALTALKILQAKGGGGLVGGLVDKMIPKVEAQGSLATLMSGQDPQALNTWNEWDRYGLRQG